ncbi:hypothetical protein GCM10027275_29800 [Rhabdobacter roseus]
MFAGLSLALSSCKECGPQAEPMVSVQHIGRRTFQSITALGAVNDSVFRRIDSDHYSYQLPLSLLADSTTYLFVSETRVDTLTIRYRRLFYDEKGCGFVVDVAPPEERYSNSDFQTIFKGKYTTFEEVWIKYGSYVGEYRNYADRPQGVVVTIYDK